MAMYSALDSAWAALDAFRLAKPPGLEFARSTVGGLSATSRTLCPRWPRRLSNVLWMSNQANETE
jgi:hypothetical protein